MAPRLLLPTLGLAVALVAFVVIRVCADDSGPGTTGEVVGVVVDVTPGEGFGVARFVLITATGDTLTFAVAPQATDGEGGPVTYGHMLQDAALGEETLVRYWEEGAARIAVVVGHPRGHSPTSEP